MSAANPEQAEFWNERPGRGWVRHGDDLDAMHRGVLDLLLAACAPLPGERALDLGCGAGASTLALARAVAPGGRALGLDISAPLLARAEERRAEAGVADAAFLRADAQDHPLEPGAWDLAASRFGVMFFADPVAAFANIARGLRPGGRVVFAAWGPAELNPWFDRPERIARGRLGLGPPEPSDGPGPMAFRDVGRVVGLLRAAGLRDARGEGVAVDLHHPDGVAGVMRVAAVIGPMARLLREAEPTERERAAIMEAVAAELAPFEGPGGIRIPARINLFRAAAAA